jgi:hypothetical protein
MSGRQETGWRPAGKKGIPLHSELSADPSESTAGPQLEGDVAPDHRGPWWRSSGAFAMGTWLVMLPVSLAAPRLLDVNPVSVRGAIAPMVVLSLLVAGAMAVLWRRRASDALVGVLAGVYSAWFVFMGRAMLYGTPFGYSGLDGDAKRIVAMAVRYTTTWAATDAITKGAPAEYPPLFAWLVGRGSVITGIPPYHLIAIAQILVMSLAVLFAFVLWQRLVSPLAALGISMVVLVGYDAPDKPYEVIALTVVVPWILLTFAHPPRSRMHWLPAGLIGGLMVLTYQGFFVFAGIGVLILMWRTWRAAEKQVAELRRFAYIALTAFVVSSWYVLPYVWGILTLPTQVTSDTYQIHTYLTDPIPLPFLQPQPSSLLLLTGLAGLVWWRNALWWAKGLGILLLGTYAFDAVGVIRFVLSGHNMFAHYSGPLVAEILAAAGVLTLAQVLVTLVARFDAPRVRSFALVFSAVFAITLSLGYWQVWRRDLGRPLALADNPMTEPLPGGGLPKYAAPSTRQHWLPIWQIRDEVEARYGVGYKPTVLTYDERIFAYLPWYLYMQPGAAVSGTFVQFDKRSAAMEALQNETDPARFAELVRTMEFGPIDVFLLKEDPDGKWRWRGITRFDPKIFDSAAFDVVRLVNGYVLVIRKP